MCDKCSGTCFDASLHMLRSDHADLKERHDVLLDKYAVLLEDRAEHKMLLGDIVEGSGSVTVAGFNPVTMKYVSAYINGALVPLSEGIGYNNNFNGNVFQIAGTPSASYPGSFILIYK